MNCVYHLKSSSFKLLIARWAIILCSLYLAVSQTSSINAGLLLAIQRYCYCKYITHAVYFFLIIIIKKKQHRNKVHVNASLEVS